jgi:hypothetical protein
MSLPPPAVHSRAGWPRWATGLFPVARASGWPRALVVGGYVLGAALLGTLALLRQSGVPAASTVWAEDARVFYAQALKMPFGRTLFTTYNGYAQLVPRLLAQFAREAPPDRAAEVFAVAGAVSFALTACLVFHMAKGHIASPLVRGVLVAAMALLPIATSELLDNVLNVPWWLFFAAFWALLWRPQTAPGLVVAGAVGLLATASEPLVALFAPLAMVRAVTLRPRREHAVTAGLVLGLVYQGAARLATGSKHFTPAPLHGIGQDFAERAGLALLGGMRGSDWLIARSPTVAVAVGALIACAVVVAGLSARSPGVRAFTVAAAVFSVVSFVVPVWLRGVSAVLSTSTLDEGSRYEAVPLLLLISVVLVVAGHLSGPGVTRAARAVDAPRGGGRPPRRARWSGRKAVAVPLTCAVLFLPSWVADFRDANLRSHGPTWQSQLALARSHCQTSHARTATLLIDPPGWKVALPCRALR